VKCYLGGVKPGEKGWMHYFMPDIHPFYILLYYEHMNRTHVEESYAFYMRNSSRAAASLRAMEICIIKP
jgi:hypothetical protein